MRSAPWMSLSLRGSVEGRQVDLLRPGLVDGGQDVPADVLGLAEVAFGGEEVLDAVFVADSLPQCGHGVGAVGDDGGEFVLRQSVAVDDGQLLAEESGTGDRKSTRLNSSHVSISYAVFCLRKKT